MDEIFVHSNNSDDYLTVQFQQTFWQALVKHAPGALDYLRTHGVEAWLERYGLPREPWEQVGTDFLELGDPLKVELRNFGWSDPPSKTPRLLDYLDYLEAHDYDSSRATTEVKKDRERLEERIADVEQVYTVARRKWEQVKHEKRVHFAWLAMRLDGKTCEEIANMEAQKHTRKGGRGKPPTPDEIDLATRRLAQLLGIRLFAHT